MVAIAATEPYEIPDASAPGPDPDPDREGAPWWHPSGMAERASCVSQSVQKEFVRQPFARVTLAVPRTARFLAGQVLGGRAREAAGVPSARITPALVGHVVMDESIMALAVGPNRFPRRADYVRVGDELTRAHALFSERGWLDDPGSYHRDPPAMEEPAVTRGWALGQSYERLWWPSGYEPHLGVPGTDRWLAFESNRTASAWVLRRRDRPRPWLVCLHGFGTGSPFMDLVGFHASHLHNELGVNIAALVLPVHGARRPSRISGEEFLGFELMNSVHGITQALWDARRLLSWVRRQDPAGVGVFGISLGGLVASLVAAFESELDLVLAGIPVVDFPGLIEHHAPRHLLMRSIEHNILNGTAQDVHRVVSPLAMPTVAPTEARAIFAGLGDRLATTNQARRLRDHWGNPEMSWFAGNHVGYLWSDTAWQFVNDMLERRGLTSELTR